jgi:hypothetical protein
VTDHPRSPEHAEHDATLVAAFAAGDTDADADAGAALVARCEDCAALAADLRALAAATRALPVPERTRDFRLTPAQERANRPRWYRPFLAPFAASSQPRRLGAILVTIGLAGVFIGLLPGSPVETFQGFGRDLGLGAVTGAAKSDQVAGAPEASAAAGSPGAAVVPGVSSPCSSPDTIIFGPLGCQAPSGTGVDAAAGDASPGPSAASDGHEVAGASSTAPGSSVAPEAAGPTSVAPAPSGQGEREAVPSRLVRDDRPFLALSAIVLLAGLLILGLVIAARRLGVDGG